jgi:hypothetical protein
MKPRNTDIRIATRRRRRRRREENINKKCKLVTTSRRPTGNTEIQNIRPSGCVACVKHCSYPRHIHSALPPAFPSLELARVFKFVTRNFGIFLFPKLLIDTGRNLALWGLHQQLHSGFSFEPYRSNSKIYEGRLKSSWTHHSVYIFEKWVERCTKRIAC